MIAENQTSLKATACNNACLASITFLFGVLFYVFTTDESKYGKYHIEN